MFLLNLSLILGVSSLLLSILVRLPFFVSDAEIGEGDVLYYKLLSTAGIVLSSLLIVMNLSFKFFIY